MDNLVKLTELTEKLPPIETSFVQMTDSSSLFLAKHGTILGWKLINDFGFGVHKWFISKGTEMGMHSHESIESITVCKGKMTVYIDSKEFVLAEGDSIKTFPNTIHNAICNEDTWAITVTIPFAKGFPK
jgi:quercetin dioxygenase-like cupin family protein